MIQNFDIFHQHEPSYVVLCNPDKTELYSLDMIYDAIITQKFNALSEFNFTIPETINDVSVDAYNFVVNKRLVLVENVGYFIIENASEKMAGMVNVKEVKSISLEAELLSKRMTSFKGTFKFYDPVSPEGTLLYEVLKFAPRWSIGTIDSDLWTKYRTFDVNDNTVYNFLMTDVATAYGCIFTFDTYNRSISVKTIDNSTTETDIFLSFDNLITDANLEEKSDEITTCLYVYGAGNLDISTVNPLGTAAIYNFDYYKNIGWMSQGLIDALNSWESQIDIQQPIYAEKLTQLKDINDELIVLDGELNQLNGEYLTLEGIQRVRIEMGIDYSGILTQMEEKQVEIDAKQAEIDSKTLEKNSVFNELTTIHELLSFENNFTPEQLIELDGVTFENTYQNKNFIQTTLMTNAEIQEMAQDLYNQAVQVISRISQPRYEFSINSANFIFLEDFLPFTSQLQLGCTVTVGIKEEYTITTALLSLSYSLYSPDKMELSFSNRLRLDNGNFIFSDLFGQPIKTGTDTDFLGVEWGSWSNNWEDSVSTFINSALDASNNNIINSSGQEIIINQNGLRGRSIDPNSGLYRPTQMWLTSNTLAFTDDNWQHSKLALGQITLDGGGTAFGLVGDVIVGKILAGNQLTITNENNKFTVDSNGATLIDASLSINSNNSKIVMNPTDGIKIISKINEVWTDVFYVDLLGNLNFRGNLTGATGTFSGTLAANAGIIGGWEIYPEGLYSPNNRDYLQSNGSVKLGPLEIYTDGSGAFRGKFYVENLVGKISHLQIESVDAGTITVGYLSGDRIYGGTICWPGACLGVTGTGASLINANASVTIRAGGSAYEFTGSGVGFLKPLEVTGRITASSLSISGSGGISTILGGLNVGGRLQANNGVDSNVVVTSPSGTKSLHFVAGTFTGWNYL